MAAVSAAQATTLLLSHTRPRADSGTWNSSLPVKSQVRNFPNHIRKSLLIHLDSPSKIITRILLTLDTLKALQKLPPNSWSSKSYSHALSHQITRPNVSQQHTDLQISMRPTGNVPSSSAQPNVINIKDRGISDTDSVDNSVLESHELEKEGMDSLHLGYRAVGNGNKSKDGEDLDSSRWIHRDKLARIENKELQDAGIFVPRSRSPSKASSRREHSKDLQLIDTVTESSSQWQQRTDSLPTEEEEAPENNSWDLRLPEESATEDFHTDASSGGKVISRIPVNKKSPLPIPIAHLERDRLLPRKKSCILSCEDEGLSYSKTRETTGGLKDKGNSRRSVSENIITKKTGTRSRSASINRVNAQRPSTRSGSVSLTSPSCAGENAQAASRHPEGDPPWLSSMYKPDPRLPPDQQLLPTVAKRLQQEKWEKEGKFGTIYDTSFRPLNDLLFKTRPTSGSEQTRERNTSENEDKTNEEWPLPSPKSPTLSMTHPATQAGYSTMPKITETSTSSQSLQNPKVQTKIPEPQEVAEKKEKKCGCCVIM